jgi:hypothetical protein
MISGTITETFFSKRMILNESFTFTGFGLSIDVNKAHLTIKQRDNIIEFEPHRIPYDSIIIDGHYGSIYRGHEAEATPGGHPESGRRGHREVPRGLDPSSVARKRRTTFGGLGYPDRLSENHPTPMSNLGSRRASAVPR